MAWIIATLGPATKERVFELYKQRVEILRFNFPHFNYETATEYAQIIHKVEREAGYKFKLLLDTQGPGIRIGDIEEPISYKEWDIFKMVVDEKYKKENTTLCCDYPHLIHDVNKGNVIKIDAWYFDVQVVDKCDEYLTVKALNSAVITSKRHVNLPWVTLRLPVLSDKDKEDVLFGIKMGFDYVALSFVRSEEDVQELRTFLDQNWGSQLEIISKIENADAVNDLVDIVDYSDLVMVARGDLWTELPVESVPSYQRTIIKKTKMKGKKVIVATQMLESMIENPSPTRAEVSDIFYAVGQGADYVMLSWETAMGKYPLECIKVMKKIIAEANKHIIDW